MEHKISSCVAEIEESFSELGKITDVIACLDMDAMDMMYEHLEKMKVFVAKLQSWDMTNYSTEEVGYYMSHMSFHREIMADIIAEARSLLWEDSREYLKSLVSYHKELCLWMKAKEKALKRNIIEA